MFLNKNESIWMLYVNPEQNLSRWLRLRKKFSAISILTPKNLIFTTATQFTTDGERTIDMYMATFSIRTPVGLCLTSAWNTWFYSARMSCTLDKSWVKFWNLLKIQAHDFLVLCSRYSYSMRLNSRRNMCCIFEIQRTSFVF